jgi:hypothetical protein
MKYIPTFESFLNESLSDSSAYKLVVDLLKTLHGFSGKIKFRTEEVNGYYNIVYEDAAGITDACLTGLRNRQLWNTEFAPSIGKFDGKRVNIHFEKESQKVLNIEDFDKKNWSPESFQ